MDAGNFSEDISRLTGVGQSLRLRIAVSSWRDLLGSGGTRVLPWVGGRRIHDASRSWTIRGSLPREHGWYSFEVSGGRDATLGGPADRDLDYGEGLRKRLGYVVGDRFIADNARVTPDPDLLITQTQPVFLVEPGLDRFARAVVVADRDGRLIYLEQRWPEGPEIEVVQAYQDRKPSIAHVRGVTPALDLAFRWLSWGRERARELAEQRRAEARELARLMEEERLAEEEARRVAELERTLGTGHGRRAMAHHDFEAAARAALAISGAELLDVIPSVQRDEVRVQYRFRNRRLECVCHRRTLRIVDAGACLTDHEGTRGDTFFTLESLPAVIGQAMDEDRLVVWRHIDENGYYEDD